MNNDYQQINNDDYSISDIFSYIFENNNIVKNTITRIKISIGITILVLIFDTYNSDEYGNSYFTLILSAMLLIISQTKSVLNSRLDDEFEFKLKKRLILNFKILGVVVIILSLLISVDINSHGRENGTLMLVGFIIAIIGIISLVYWFMVLIITYIRRRFKGHILTKIGWSTNKIEEIKKSQPVNNKILKEMQTKRILLYLSLFPVNSISDFLDNGDFDNIMYNYFESKNANV